MRIVWERSIYVGNFQVPCAICGHRAGPIRTRNNQVLLAVIYDAQGRFCGEACRSCVESGSEGIRERLHERIHSLQDKLQELKNLDQGEVEIPTLEQELQAHLG